MSQDPLNSEQAAQGLGIAASTLYQWLSQSDAGEFLLRGQPVTIRYRQSGAKGQGRIHIDAAEVERLKEAMQVRPRVKRERRRSIPRPQYPGITVPLGRPDD